MTESDYDKSNNEHIKERLLKMLADKDLTIDELTDLIQEGLKNNPETYLATSKISSKSNKDKKGNVSSYSYSTAIPKPILNKLGLKNKQVLYWDIEDDKIIITPENILIKE